MRKTLTFRANGHQCRIVEGELLKVSPLSWDLRTSIPGIGSGTCGTCDARLELVITDKAIEVREPCPYPDGITTEILLEVPSGKVIVTDDLRPVYSWDEEGLASYNSALGQHQAIEAMAKAGCAYGPVGNTCPGLYRTGPGTYAIASPAYDHDEDREVLPAGWEYLAGIVSDLWAYSIADYEDWTSRGGDPAALCWADTVLDIPAGTYQFTHHTGERTFNPDAEGTVIFADIEKLEEAEPS